MRAITINQHGGPEELRLDQLPEPTPGPGEVLLNLKAAALNHLDIWVRGGIPGLKLTFPHIMGSDGAGVISEAGEGVENVSPGDRVLVDPGISCGHCEYCRNGQESQCIDFHLLGEHINGTYADYAVVPGKNIYPIPSHLSYEEAAALPLVTITAWRMLISRAGLTAGEDLLIIGVGGGVASAALQIGLEIGARVIVTSGDAEKIEKALELGAYHAFNHHELDIVDEVKKATDRRGVDVCADSAGAATWDKSLRSLAKGGRLVTCGVTAGPIGETDIRRLFWNQLSIFGSTMGSRNDVREMLRFVEEREMKPIIDSIYPIEEAADAHNRLIAGKQFGKVVLKITD